MFEKIADLRWHTRCTRGSVEVVAMKPIHVTDLVGGLSALVLTPMATWAQFPSAPLPVQPSAGPSPGESGSAVIGLLTLVVLVGVIAGVVKLFDFKRRRDDAAMALEAGISDVLLVHPQPTGLPVRAVAHVPLAHQSEPVIEVRGTVPTPELRDVAVDTVRHELFRQVPAARVEDRIMVDPLMLKRVA
jgi:hypothetical protein